MTGHDAFEGEMNHEVESFLSALRATVPEQPDPSIEGPLVQRLAETARTAHVEAENAPTAVERRKPSRFGAWRRRVALPARIAIAAGLLVLSPAALAAAGVELPGPVDDVYDTVGVNLPNQTDDDAISSDSDEGEDVSGEKSEGKDKNKANKKSRAGKKSHGKKGTPPGLQDNPSDPQGQAVGQGGTPPGQAKEKGSSNSKSRAVKPTRRPPKVHPPKPPPPTKGNSG